jgi:recombination protein RecR
VAVYAGPVQDLIDELGRLPGVGPKSAQRIAFHLLKLDKQDALRLARAIAEVKDKVSFCRTCFNVAEGEQCGICADPRRDATVVCVVEEPRDLVAVEKTGEFSGRYHVLQGAISPIEGVGPDQLRVRELLDRIGREGVTEVILCTNPNLEGEATAMYLGRLIKPLGIRVTRIASGLPVGGDLEYADELTLGRALEGRRDVEAGKRPRRTQVRRPDGRGGRTGPTTGPAHLSAPEEVAVTLHL